MNKLLETIEIKYVNGLYRIYLFNYRNALPKLAIYQVVDGQEVPVKNVYTQLKR